MGNYRFKLSDMMPNAWFYKLKDMSKTKKHKKSPSTLKKKLSPTTCTPQNSHLSQSGFNIYRTEPTKADRVFYSSPVNSKASDSTFPDPPRNSSKRKSKRRAIYKPSNELFFPSLTSARPRPNPIQYSPDYFLSSRDSSTSEPNLYESISSTRDCENFVASDPFAGLVSPSWSSSCNCRLSSSTRDIIIDLNEDDSINKAEMQFGFDLFSELELPQIQTKPLNLVDGNNKYKRSSSKLEDLKGQKTLYVKNVKEERIRTKRVQNKNSFVQKSRSNSTGVRLRANSPKLANKKIQACARKSISSRNKKLSDSFAVVKSSIDPQKDFRNSMREMILQNDIKAYNDLEELLACYLSLNSKEYHGLIVKAFEQIWFDMAEI